MNSSFNVGQNARSIHPEKLDQIIEAIAVGKYSWACVLMLRFSGYNPLHYMPYSTYNRIVKDVIKEAQPDTPASVAKSQTAIQDLAYVESVPEEAAQCTGGFSGWRSVWRF
jgi:hypothetical protein